MANLPAANPVVIYVPPTAPVAAANAYRPRYKIGPPAVRDAIDVPTTPSGGSGLEPERSGFTAAVVAAQQVTPVAISGPDRGTFGRAATAYAAAAQQGDPDAPRNGEILDTKA